MRPFGPCHEFPFAGESIMILMFKNHFVSSKTQVKQGLGASMCLEENTVAEGHSLPFKLARLRNQYSWKLQQGEACRQPKPPKVQT